MIDSNDTVMTGAYLFLAIQLIFESTKSDALLNTNEHLKNKRSIHLAGSQIHFNAFWCHIRVIQPRFLPVLTATDRYWPVIQKKGLGPFWC